MKDLTRYTCQMALPDFDEAAQQKLLNARVLVVGAGGLGCPALQYLAAMGVGTIGIADGDTVSEKNLHRQILYTPADIGKYKVTVAQKMLQLQNPAIQITAHNITVDSNNVIELYQSYDIVVDCTDNFETRYLLNDAAVLTNKPLVYGAIYQHEGQVAVWNVARGNHASPNYRDLFPDVNAAAVPNCVEGGVIPTIAGIIGCAQANEVVKYITGVGELLAGKLLIFDAQTMHTRTLKLGATTKTNITQLPHNTAVKEIDVAELQASINDYNLIDVRTTEERNSFNIGGQHIPLTEIDDCVIDTKKTIVCYCASGKRSAIAVKILSEKYPDAKIYSLNNGLDSWY